MEMHGTTICAVKKDGHIAIAGDGQCTGGNSVIIKGNCRKVRRIYDDKIIIGFAGSVADAFTLYEHFEQKLKAYNGDMTRAAVELAKLWRMDKQLRNLEAQIIATDGKSILSIDGTGNVLEPEWDAFAIGSGGNYAYAAARAYLDCNTDLSAEEIAKRAVGIAADICVFTNHNIITEVI